MSYHYPRLDAETATSRLRAYLSDGELRTLDQIEAEVGPTGEIAIEALFASGELAKIHAASMTFYQKKDPESSF